jgi:RimJ/RimL family protein N-acetyltransferase
MHHEFLSRGKAFSLRPVMVSDSAFIVGLRTNRELSAFINATSNSIPDQEAWITRYLSRPGDYYWIVQNEFNGESEGTISIYDANEAQGSAEWGRWILRKGSLAAVESTYLLYCFAFESLGLNRLYCRTVATNHKVVSFHTSLGLQTVGVLRDQFEINGCRHDAIEQQMSSAMWQDMKIRHAALSDRTAGLIHRFHTSSEAR